MISPTVRQTSLFYLAFAHQAALIKDDLLDTVDTLLDDPVLVDLVRQALAGRSPRSLATPASIRLPARATPLSCRSISNPATKKRSPTAGVRSSGATWCSN